MIWIKVEDRLPDNHEKVLTITLGLIDICRYDDDKWFSLCFNATMKDGAVSHWMQLPELPK